MIRPARLVARLRHDERGVTMYLVIAVMFITSVLTAAVLTGTSTDAALGRRDLDAKKAVYAAQAGVAAYLQQLNANPNYWTTCPTSANYSGGGTVALPGATTNDESYSYTPLPAPGYSACDPNNPVTSMVTSQGTFRVQFNGFSGVADGSAQPVAHSTVVTFKHQSFLNYTWFTMFEQQNPSIDPSSINNVNSTSCVGLTEQQILNKGWDWPNNGPCTLVNWVTGDDIHGPMFSDDDFYVCGQPIWGSKPTDLIYTQNTVNNTGCSGNSPQVNPSNATNPNTNYGTLQETYQPLTIPQSNDTLAYIAKHGGAYYTGFTQITLNGSTYNITTNGSTTTGVAWPSNGVIYVDQSSTDPCSSTYSPFTERYTEYASGQSGYGCGTVEVSGTYSKSLTIASAQDVIITGSLTYTTGSNALLGLVPQDWARIYHEVVTGNGAVTDCQTTPSANNSSSDNALTNPTIDAAILTTTDSWIVDNYNCGGFQGNLTVNGSISQYYRGPVGTGGSGGTGYLKNYWYDSRLQDESPPYFLSPVDPAWSVQSESQCSSVGHLPSAAATGGSNQLVPSANQKTCY